MVEQLKIQQQKAMYDNEYNFHPMKTFFHKQIHKSWFNFNAFFIVILFLSPMAKYNLTERPAS